MTQSKDIVAKENKEKISLQEQFAGIDGIGNLEDIKFFIDSPEEVGLDEIKLEVERMLQAIKLGKVQVGIID